jgi:hypothetical protein
MYAMNRLNRSGQQYFLTELPSGDTRIVTGDKILIVKHDIQVISQAWYNWQVRGEKIQDAFDFFTDAEREFLKTGLTEAEWKAIFSEKEN